MNTDDETNLQKWSEQIYFVCKHPEIYGGRELLYIQEILKKEMELAYHAGEQTVKKNYCPPRNQVHSMKKKQNECVQCGLPIIHWYGSDEWRIPFCEHAHCPNYGLLQTGIVPKKKSIIK